MNIESKWLEDFLVLSDTRNFSAAAAVRNITQPAFSRRIRMLEQSVGAELVDRTQTPIALTPSGRIFRVTARTLINQIAESVGEISALNYTDGSTVRIASAHSLACRTTRAIQHAFSKKGTPLLSIEAMNVDEAVEALKQGGCDILLAFDNEYLKLPPFEHIKMGAGNLTPVSGVDSSGGPLFDLDEGESLPWLAYSPSLYMGRQLESVRQHLSLKPVFISSMVDLLKDQAIKGNGVAWLPDFLITEEILSGTLVTIGDASHQRHVSYFAYRYQSRLHPSGEQVWSSLKKLQNKPDNV
ncbi:LysR family transcriptional regulator [Enterovibrio nigricans]|uniref:DNA-binding transcriptional regulator, LysR family n=1 Tax=Enterovibrio nigricans DSM 22720 TaxID=1121868 RepID=A0A1T4UI43_9GAMM|nr:LysR family transcriptional regulator [Enterovibrio nigricans]SKA52415.1 DNA-binding transcriptional regulator, LysR family [Enterovibrio nigricans DSM 22720]